MRRTSEIALFTTTAVKGYMYTNAGLTATDNVIYDNNEGIRFDKYAGGTVTEQYDSG